MALLERVTTLVRANLNDLIDKAEDPEKMIKQVILDMQNQLLQVKTQVAIAIADEHLLEKKQKENEDASAAWMRKAELAVDRKQDDLARGAIERSVSYRDLAVKFTAQVADQKTQVDNLKSALRKLEQKLVEARSKADLLVTQHRRSRAASRAAQAGLTMGEASKSPAFDRLRRNVVREEADAAARNDTMEKGDLLAPNVEERLAALERDDAIEQMLNEIKARRKMSA